jgi:pimeloyl-ACP methyl ester carboxylesterase
MKMHRHDIAVVFSDTQDKVLSEKARGWPLPERKTTSSLYTLVNFVLALFALSASSFAASDAKKFSPATKPTIVLVHGAFAESSSWNGVVKRLLAQGYPVVAAANPLRGLHSDAEYVATIFKSIPGPIVAVGHSYGGSVITDAAAGNSNVKALVYVAGLAPDTGESAADIGGRFPGSTLGPTLAPPTTLPDGGKDLYIQQDKFPLQFAADVPKPEAKLMAATQRPVTESALHEAVAQAAWKTIPSWFIFGSLDKNITEAAHKFMAQRANAKATVDVKGASHVVMVSHPDAVTALIEKAAENIGQ